MWRDDTQALEFHVLVWSDGDSFLYHKHLSPESLEDPATVLPLAHVVPTTFYRAIPTPELTPAPEHLLQDTYVKTPSRGIVAYDPKKPSSTTVADIMLHEAQICEQLARHPHRHICEYRGYSQKHGLMAGLCFKRYGKNLYDAVRDGDPLDTESVLEGVQGGIEHIHGLGLVHNDINPSNIVLDDESQPIIIDFDSCCAPGARGIKGGTPGWCIETNFNIAKKENDWYGFEKIKRWFLDPDHKDPEPWGDGTPEGASHP
ncbi:hypothetical protein B0H21DRAFT_744683 [Amylocystis lapponica]|nr:hypothetical protein B0H21DRAFT_744683 [Amylocystis lapponica]